MRRTEKIALTGSGGDQLSAALDLPSDRPAAYALFAHGFTSSDDVSAVMRIARGLVDQGFAVLRFESVGIVDDLMLAAGYLRDAGEAPRLLVGHGRGGAAALVAASQLPEVVALATIGAPFDPAHGPAIASLGKALAVFHSPEDATIGIDDARQIFDAARHPKTFIAVDNADHLLSRRADSHYVARVLAAWAGRYLSPDADESMSEAGPPAEGTVIVSSSPRGRLTQDIQAGEHRLSADEPAGAGDDLGPTPYDLLLAALGACTSMTLRLYADRQGWALDGVSVELHHARVHAQDCAECEGAEGVIDRIDRTLTLTGVLDDDQRAALLAIADKCPVHRTLMNDKRIVTKLAPS